MLRACKFYTWSCKHLQVIDGDVTVHDSNGVEIESQILPLAEAFVNLRNYYVKAYLGENPSKTPKYWLAFSVSVPPFGFSTYTVSTAKKTGSHISCFILHQASIYLLSMFHNMNSVISVFCLFLGSTRSSVYTHQSHEKSSFGQGNLKLTFSTDQEKRINYVNARNMVRDASLCIAWFHFSYFASFCNFFVSFSSYTLG